MPIEGHGDRETERQSEKKEGQRDNDRQREFSWI